MKWFGMASVAHQNPGTGGLSHRLCHAATVSGKLKRGGGKETWCGDGSRDKEKWEDWRREIYGHEQDELRQKDEYDCGLESICRETFGRSGDEGGKTGEGNAADDMQPREGLLPASSLEIDPGERAGLGLSGARGRYREIVMS